MQKIYFIINPKSGNKRLQKKLPKYIGKYLSAEFKYEIDYTKHAGHARILAEEIVKKGDADIIAVAGGDGSINEILPAIMNTNVSLAILPAGSGNGLARHLGYPMNVKKVIKEISLFNMEIVDVGQSGHLNFSSNAGAGFDGFIARSFSKGNKRGFWGYASRVLRYLLFYKPFNYHLQSNGDHREGKAFMVTFFNSNQYGFNVKMATNASVKDGVLEAYVVESFPRIMAPIYVVAVLMGWHKRFKNIHHLRGKSFTLEMNEPIDFHIDGEDIGKLEKVQVESIPSSLKVLIPNGQEK